MHNLIRRFKTMLRRIFMLILLSFSSLLFASEETNRVIDKMIAAYGGETLTSAKSITIDDKYKELYTGQGVSATFTEVYKHNVSLTIDYARKRKSLTAWENKERGNRLTKTIFDGSSGRTYNLLHQKFDESQRLSFDGVGSSIIRSHDTLLARLVWDNKGSAQFVGDSHYRNIPHEKVKIKLGSGPAFTLYINKANGLISKVTRPNSHYGELTYVFSNHKVTQGVTFAADLLFSVAGEPYRISISRKIAINPSLTRAFNEPEDFEARGETIDTSKMSVRKLGDGVYFAGQGHAYSLFIDAGSYFYGTGGNAGLKERFRALQKAEGYNKPLRYQIVTHHHSDHLSGMKDAADLGAKFITVADHISSVQASLVSPIPQDKYLIVNNKASYANGKVEVYDIPSTHSEHNLMVYVPSAKLMFTADHFSSDLKDNLPNVDKGTVVLRKAIQDLQLDVEKFLGAHGARILTNEELQMVANSYSGEQCPTGIKVCSSE